MIRHPHLAARRASRWRRCYRTLDGFLAFLTFLAFTLLAALIMAAC